jgi:hypothetical protein
MRDFYLQDDAVDSTLQEINTQRQELLELVQETLRSTDKGLTEQQEERLQALADALETRDDHEEVSL